MIAPLLTNIVVKQSKPNPTTGYEYRYIIFYPNIDRYNARNSLIYLTIGLMILLLFTNSVK